MSSGQFTLGEGMTPSTTKLGGFMRKRRLALGLTQPEAAERAGIIQSFWSDLEVGKRKFLNADQLTGVIRTLKCTEAELREAMGTNPRDKGVTNLGHLIRARSKEIGVRRADIMEALGTEDRSRVSEIERSERVSLRTAQVLAEVLKLPLGALLPTYVR